MKTFEHAVIIAFEIQFEIPIEIHSHDITEI